MVNKKNIAIVIMSGVAFSAMNINGADSDSSSSSSSGSKEGSCSKSCRDESKKENNDKKFELMDNFIPGIKGGENDSKNADINTIKNNKITKDKNFKLKDNFIPGIKGGEFKTLEEIQAHIENTENRIKEEYDDNFAGLYYITLENDKCNVSGMNADENKKVRRLAIKVTCRGGCGSYTLGNVVYVIKKAAK